MMGPWKVVEDGYGGCKELASGPSCDYARGYADACIARTARTARVVGPDYGCQCGPDRDEIVKEGDECFFPRIGCKRCNQWDGPPKLR